MAPSSSPGGPCHPPRPEPMEDPLTQLSRSVALCSGDRSNSTSQPEQREGTLFQTTFPSVSLGFAPSLTRLPRVQLPCAGRRLHPRLLGANIYIYTYTYIHVYTYSYKNDAFGVETLHPTVSVVPSRPSIPAARVKLPEGCPQPLAQGVVVVCSCTLFFSALFCACTAQHTPTQRGGAVAALCPCGA